MAPPCGRVWRSVALATIVAAIAACTRRSSATRDSFVVSAGDSIVVSTRDSAAHLYRGIQSGFTDSSRLVLQDSAAFEAARNRIGSADPGVPPRAPVDMRTDDVLLAALGLQPAIGPRISIDTVLIRGDERIVIVRRTHSSGPCSAAPAVTQPIDVVIVPADRGRRTRFVERIAEVPCP